MVKVGDIIEGRKVTKVYELCGGIAYQSVPAETKTEVKTEEETKPKKRIVRKKKEQ
jgi:hypothetical protein